MADELFGFTAAQILRLRRVLERVESDDYPTLNRMPRNLLPAGVVVVGLLESGVAATTTLTSTPKVGTINIYSFSSTGTLDTGIDEACFNFAPQIATTDRWTFCVRDAVTGRLVIDYQACS